MSNYNELVKRWADELTQYSPEEANNLINWLLEYHLGLRKVDMVEAFEENSLSESLYQDFERLKTGEPVQYIIGKAPFYGREFFVDESVLIPRNETEELVHMIIKENPKPGMKILDIGTGSGCIPISLALEMKDSEVYSVDVSEDAIEVALENAEHLESNVTFIHLDILKETPAISDLDILVSNPPYVPEAEWTDLHSNVRDFEPGLALFVPDHDPLLFYRVIAEKGKLLLKKGGKLYYEIHNNFGPETVELLESLGYKEINLVKDLNDKNRMVSATFVG
ncbi:peptide chain release factor N(5)-glutamine methyltransferase [Algoriphagus sp.]|uniref:peptide chain release factor N(5)-glutamine methyltransferase n=1 Tax=Algoriphagus sp. TaxID=1872435 RepID=UPI0025DD0EA6|nr:peptide chain release factor N(5)-glutamine methyltransferase [Algoriphagus sp.]